MCAAAALTAILVNLAFGGRLSGYELRQLAENTDGMAVVNTNDLEGAMKRIVSDLTSYYLLGYYSDSTKWARNRSL